MASLLAAWATFHGLAWCVLLFPVLLARALQGASPRKRLLFSAGWGTLFAAGFYHWVGAYGLLPWAALSVVRGLPWTLFTVPTLLLMCRREKNEEESPGLSWSEIIGGSLGLGLVATALLLGPTGVDWETPAGALTGWPSLLSPLRWVGLGSLASGLALISLCLGSGRWFATAVGASLLLLWTWGAPQLAVTETTRPDLTVALLQTGFSQDEKWDESRRLFGVERLLAKSEEAAAEGAELVVWPETAWPYRGMRRRVTNTRKIGKAARNLKVDILASSIEEDLDTKNWRNSVSLVRSSGQFGEHYEKRRLAPFAEYLPLPEPLQSGLRRFRPFSGISRFVPGSESVVFTTSRGHRFAVLICYESMTPAMAAQMAPLVDFLVVVTNDAPFAHSQANEAHFRSAILRAIQTERPVLQAANTGVTGIVLENGTVVARTSPGEYGPSVQYLRP